MKRLLSLSAAAALLGSAAFAEVTIGVSWSNFQEERWKTDEAAIVSALDAAGAARVLGTGELVAGLEEVLP